MEKLITILIDILCGIFSFLFLIFAILSYSNTKFDTNLISAYRNNWNQSPIETIIVTSQPSCPSGFQPLISSTYPGNIQGCDCTQSKKKDYKKKVFKTACEEDMIIFGCKVIKENDEVPLSKWQGKAICAKRVDNTQNYFNYTQYAYEDSCPLNKKKCGILDTANNVYCVDEGKECPINYLEILPKTEESLFPDKESYDLNDQFSLHFSNEVTNGPIIVSVVATPSIGEICSHPYEGLIAENDYLLNKRQGNSTCHTKIGNYKYDWRYSLVDTDNMKTFYTMNNIDQYISALPEYPHPKDTDSVMLHSINYFGIHGKCLRKSIDINFLDPHIGNLEKEGFGIVIVCVTQLIFIVCAVFVYKIACKYMLSSRVILSIDVIEVVFLVLIFGLGLGFSLNVAASIKPYNSFISNNCGDELTNNVLKIAFKPLFRSNQYYVVIYSLAVIVIGIKSLYYVWFYLFRKNSN